jgi:flagellar hook protein FlgE
MSFSTFYTGVSGLKSYQSAIDITSNNIANVSTVGFRSYNTEFSSIYENVMNSGAPKGNVTNTIGGGVRVQASSMSLDKGSISLTDRNTDLAIDGDGWFGVQNGVDGSTPLYTRNGNFTFDKNGSLVTDDSHYVLGTLAGNIKGNILTTPITEIPLNDVTKQEKLNFPKDLIYPAKPSTKVKYSGNIGIKDTLQSMSVNLINSDGTKNVLKLEFKKSATQVLPGSQWDIKATTQTSDGKTIYDTKTGTISFDSTGEQISNTLGTIDNNGLPITIDLGSKYSGIVSTNSAVNNYNLADGNLFGDLIGYEINSNAEVIASFTNGLQSSIGKIAVFHFANDQGLSRASGSKFEATSNSGKAIFFQNADGENILGAKVSNFKLENSNVAMSSALTELIIFQRAYDANAKIVTTSDQMIQKALQM